MPKSNPFFNDMGNRIELVLVMKDGYYFQSGFDD